MIPSRTLDVDALVAALTPRLARLAAEAAANGETAVADPAAAGEPTALPLADPAARATERAELLRRGLEEWGVACREEPGLTVLEAFGIASERGVEITVAADLAPPARALAYARCLARLALEQRWSLATWFHYRPGAAPQHQTPAEDRAMAVVDALARALLAGRLDATPRYLRPPAAPVLDQPPAGLLGECSRAILGGLHRASTALYWRSDSYQALRASEPMIRLTAGVHALLSVPAGPRAA